MSSASTTNSPHLWRRLLAIVYDSFLVIAVVMLSSVWMPLIPEPWQGITAVRIIKLVYILAVVYAFFGWFWTHGGQTLGMRAWKMRLYTDRRGKPTWRHALTRYLGAWLSALSFGLGFLWVLFDRDRKSWHDHWSNTYLELIRDPDT